MDDVGNYGYAPASSNQGLSYRADEDYSAFSGKSRMELFQRFTTTPVGLGNVYPQIASENDIKRTSQRGTGYKDSYIVTQITLNYIISDMVKCPPLKQ